MAGCVRVLRRWLLVWGREAHGRRLSHAVVRWQLRHGLARALLHWQAAWAHDVRAQFAALAVVQPRIV
eukprot:1773844-Prymnesium_polylepis.2